MDHPDVRAAEHSDREAVGTLWAQLLDEQADLDERVGVAEDARERWDNDFEMWLDDETARLFVVESDDRVVGFASARRWEPAPIYAASSEVYLDELFVRPEDRRRGFGSQLVNAVREWVHELGANRLRLRVLTANAAGRAFWAAQDALPLSMTLTIETGGGGDGEADEGSKKIGF